MSYFNWNELGDEWDITEEYWIIDKIIGNGGGGIDEWFGNYNKLTKEEKRHVIRLIMYRNNIKFEESKEIKVDEYNVTVNDIKTLVEDYLEKSKIKMKISEVKFNNTESTWG